MSGPVARGRRGRSWPRRCGGAAAVVAAVAALCAAAPPAEAQSLRQAVPATLKIPDQPRVRYYAERYSSAASRDWLLGVVDRASFFADYILGELDERGMPPELLFLPGIESGYFSSATSPAGRGRTVAAHAQHGAPTDGLVTDELVDERRDFWKATDVALQVLEWNHSQLGSWEMALAAYNAGMGRGEQLRALRRHRQLLGAAAARSAAARDERVRTALFRVACWRCAICRRTQWPRLERVAPVAAGAGAARRHRTAPTGPGRRCAARCAGNAPTRSCATA